MPAAFDDANAGVRCYYRAVLAYGPGADAHKLAQIVIKGVHLGDRTGGHGIHIGQRDGRRGIEQDPGGLDGYDEPGLLSEVGHHGNLVRMHHGDGDQTALAAVGEGCRPGGDGQ